VALGVIENPKLQTITDLDAREWVMFVPLIIATLWLGLAPVHMLDFTKPAIEKVVSQYEQHAP
jgi:NADH-quinone oxidoreductase subunit M